MFNAATKGWTIQIREIGGVNVNIQHKAVLATDNFGQVSDERWGQNRRAEFSLRFVSVGFLVLLGYYLGARLGFALTFAPHPVSVMWPPNAILLAALLLTSSRWWWFVVLAALPAHLAAPNGRAEFLCR